MSKKRQDKANEIRDLITRVNAVSAELKEEGYTVIFRGGRFGNIKDVQIHRVVKL